MAILGIDEVGRGPWAGPLVVGACILPPENAKNKEWLEALTDSKKLTAKRREELNELILEEATVGLGWVEAKELDEIGLAESLKLATKRAVKEIQKTGVSFTEIVIDGTTNFLTETTLEKYVSVLKKADLMIREVSAASIVAKVARDNYMYRLATKYPEYGFDRHVGYGTAKHRQAILDYGVISEHRRSFRPIRETVQEEQLKEKVDNDDFERFKQLNSNAKKRGLAGQIHGQRAEIVVEEFLKKQGQKILARNAKTRWYEIDIISKDDERLYFTEVKYRENNKFGDAAEAVNQKKQKQMKFAAEAWLATKKKEQSCDRLQPILMVATVEGADFKLMNWLELVD
ncbi:MAG: ribonuclease HII [Candidatus Saccharibacteria bacterium]|nr:ribonuclease HII [Candidatus Saccharibacteria bacterium]